MKYFFDEWGKIKKSVTGKNIFLFLDYDGTLASIADHPDKAILSDGIKKVLKKITRNPRFQVAIISGRSLKDIKSRVRIKKIIYSGNHGLEIDGPGFKLSNNITISYKKIISKIKKELHQDLSLFKGVFVEDKKMTLSIHYRLAEKKNILKIKSIFHEIVAGYLKANEVKLRTGKMVFEIMPPLQWDKGLAVLWIMSRPGFSEAQFLPVYFGDDITDEDAFRVLRKNGITVLVGYRKRSYARYYLHDVSEVGAFIEQL